MACPTCDHTMTELGCRTSGTPFFVCPRCGTARTCDGTVLVPAVIDFARRFIGQVNGLSTVGVTVALADIRGMWEKLGIRESINVAAERP